MPHRSHRPFLTLVFLAALTACQAQSREAPHAHGDSGFAAMQSRGEKAMGANQYTSAHQFEDLENGGRIALEAAAGDTGAIPRIRAHFREIARAFGAGDFTTPGFVHAGDAPGANTMSARRAVIGYSMRELPRGAELRITTSDPTALRAVHEFLAFQRAEHHAAK